MKNKLVLTRNLPDRLTPAVCVKVSFLLKKLIWKNFFILRDFIFSFAKNSKTKQYLTNNYR